MGFDGFPISAGRVIQSPDYLNQLVDAYNERRLVVVDPPAALTPLEVGDNMQSLTLWQNLWRHGWAVQWWPRMDWAKLEDFDGKPNGYNWSIEFGYDVQPYLVRWAGRSIQSASVQNLYYDMYRQTTRTWKDIAVGVSETRTGTAVVGATLNGAGNPLPSPLPAGYVPDTPEGWADAQAYADNAFAAGISNGASTSAGWSIGYGPRVLRYPPMYFPDEDGWTLTIIATRCKLVVSGVPTSSSCFVDWYGKEILSPHAWHKVGAERAATQVATVTQSEWLGDLAKPGPWPAPGEYYAGDQFWHPTFESRALLKWQFAYRGPLAQPGFAQAGFSQG